MNHEANVTKRVQTLAGLRYCPVVLSANDRIKPDMVLVDGTQEHHPEGAYYQKWREGASVCVCPREKTLLAQPHAVYAKKRN